MPVGGERLPYTNYLYSLPRNDVMPKKFVKALTPLSLLRWNIELILKSTLFKQKNPAVAGRIF